MIQDINGKKFTAKKWAAECVMTALQSADYWEEKGYHNSEKITDAEKLEVQRHIDLYFDRIRRLTGWDNA